MDVRRAMVQAGVAATLLGLARPAGAEIYDVPILVEDVDDLRDLLENGDLSEEEYDRLARRIEEPLDLRRAEAGELYDLPGMTDAMARDIVRHREKTGSIALMDLPAIGIPEGVIRQIEPFVFVGVEKKEVEKAHVYKGLADLRVVSTLAETEYRDFVLSIDPETGEEVTEEVRKGEAVAISARIERDRKIKVGFSGVVQKRLGPFTAHHEGGLTWLSAERETHRLQVPKLYVAYEERQWGVVAGSYEVGFGERLVFDDSTRVRPEGYYPDYQVYESAESAHFGVSERLYGVAARLKHLPVGQESDVDATVFASFWPYDAYQNDVDSLLRAQDDSEFEGSNPLYCVDGVDPEDCALEGVGKLSSEQLRAAYTEAIAGVHASYAPSPHFRIGTTAYGSAYEWTEAKDLVWTESAGMPNDDTYGAYGLDLEVWPVPSTLLSAEAARTSTGGNAAFLRSQTGLDQVDIEAHVRWYDEGYDNPHGRGTAESDQYLGQTDRDETGGRIRVAYEPVKAIELRVMGDLWNRPSLDVTSWWGEGRVSWEPTRELGFAAGARYTDKDIDGGGRDEDYEDSTRTVDGVEQKIVGQGSKLQAFVQASVDILKRASVTLFYKSNWTDAETGATSTDPLDQSIHEYYRTHYAHEHYASLTGSVKVVDAFALRARVKFYDDETRYDFRGESFVEGWVGFRWTIVPRLQMNARYLLRKFVDERASTLEGRPLDQFLRASVSWRF